MMKNFYKLCFCGIFGVGFIILLILSSYFGYVSKCQNGIREVAYRMPILVHKDSVSVPVKDSISQIDFVELISELRAENNLIIDKSSSWLAFWLAVLTIVFAIPAVIQTIHFFRIKEDVNELLEIKNKEFEEKLNGFKVQYDEKEKKFENLLRQMECSISENKISALTMCINSFPSVNIVSQNLNDNTLYDVNHYMDRLQGEFEQYVRSVEKKIDAGGLLDKNDRFYICMIIVELRTSTVQIQVLYPNITDNIAFYTFVQKLQEFAEKMETEILNDFDIVKHLYGIVYDFKSFMKTLQKNIS